LGVVQKWPVLGNYWLRVVHFMRLNELIKEVRWMERGIMEVICKIVCVNEANFSVERPRGIMR
jgi:hypothetical protein